MSNPNLVDENPGLAGLTRVVRVPVSLVEAVESAIAKTILLQLSRKRGNNNCNDTMTTVFYNEDKATTSDDKME